VSEPDMTTTIGYIMSDSPANKVDLHPGDKILEVDGKPVKRFLGMNESVSWAVVRSEGETIPIKFERNGEVRTVQVAPRKGESRGWFRRKSVRQLLILPEETPIIGKVQPDSPAAAAGLQAHDIVRGFNHQPIYNPVALLEYIQKHPTETLTLDVERSGSRLEIPVKPALLPTEDADGKKEMKPRIGIEWDSTTQMSIAHPNPLELVENSVTSIFNTLGAVASRKSDLGLQHLSGPLAIVRIYYLFLVSEHGWKLALWLSVVLNVNLAILNMLPIPVLDGGHILFGVIESIRRKPLNMRLLEVVQGACTILIIGTMVYITFFDFQDIPVVKRFLDKVAPQTQKAKQQDLP
jgi:regulator of sigma E protease